MQIGPHAIDPPVLLAPMAGITDAPFRALCRRMGAGLAFSEMLTSDRHLWATPKSRQRLALAGEPGPVAVQLAGTEPGELAAAARGIAAAGAEIIDLNMGCPAKKVCRRAAGSALLRDEALVGRILEAVVAAVDVPVTLKIRTGWDGDHRNAPTIARIAEEAGIAALTVHGRTRDDGYRGSAEFDTLARVREATSLPLVANGDIVDGPSALRALQRTGADAVMVGRAARGDPWVFRRIRAFLAGESAPEPDAGEVAAVADEHLRGLHALYGPEQGVRVARKHIKWYLQAQGPAGADTRRLMAATDTGEQRRLLATAYAAESQEFAA
jgi:tRNA-dihydrouridine synthase B